MRIAFVLALAATPQAEPLEISPRDPALRYVGRWDVRDAAGPRCAWAGGSVSARFQGTSVDVLLTSSGADHVQIVVDGRPSKALAVEKGKTVYPAAEGLTAAEHTIEVFKRTEPLVGTLQVLGFRIQGKLLPPPARSKRRIELVGDSITCGYGNESASEKASFAAATENNYLAYGPVAARALNAEVVEVAWSGKWLLGDNAMPALYDLTLPHDPGSRWDFSAWTADVVVINLGTNDFGPRNPTEKEWVDTGTAFVKRVRANYPKAHVFLATGSMMNDAYPPGRKALSTLRGYNRALAAALGDKSVHLVNFEPQDPKNGLGGDWHPSVKTHQLMAEVLAAAIRKELGWQP